MHPTQSLGVLKGGHPFLAFITVRCHKEEWSERCKAVALRMEEEGHGLQHSHIEEGWLGVSKQFSEKLTFGQNQSWKK